MRAVSSKPPTTASYLVVAGLPLPSMVRTVRPRLSAAESTVSCSGLMVRAALPSAPAEKPRSSISRRKR